MPKSTHPIAYEYEVEGVTIVLERVHQGTAYARNGNVSNPTEYFRWNWSTPTSHGNAPSRNEAYERARASVLGIPYRNHRYAIHCVNVRPWTVVKAEMQANYRRRYSVAEAV